MSSRPLFISVAESIVILPPIVHVGCWRASSTLTPARSARVRPRNGPPLAVSTSLSIVPGRSAEMSWCSAECSESTGMICAPVASASWVTSSPPTTSDSLLARARSMPSPSVATVGPSPTEPTSALSTRSASDSITRVIRPAGPVSTSPSVHASAARAAASRSASAMRCTPCARACSTSASHERPADRPTSSMSSEPSTISSACVPIEPVEPRMSSRRATPLGCHSKRQCPVNPRAESAQTPVDPQHETPQADGVGDLIHLTDESRSPPPWLRVAEVAAAQYGVVSFAQLRAVGLGRGAVEKAVRGERLIRLHTGVYAVGHRVLRVEGSRLAAVLACGAGAVLSHRSAGAHWGLLPTARTLVDVTMPRTRRRVPGIDLHRSRSLDARDTASHEGIPITTVARTLLDLAAAVPESRLERALAQAERLQLYDHRAITDVIARANGHRGK